MKVSLSWLREYVPVTASASEIADRLVISSCEVDGISVRGVADTNGNLGLFRVGRVLEAANHPNADRLQLCVVDLGDEQRQIVCGAWNFGVGATVAVALPGAVLPNGLQLQQRKVRGELSDGMILAEDEVDLGTDHAGIMVLGHNIDGYAAVGSGAELALGSLHTSSSFDLTPKQRVKAALHAAARYNPFVGAPFTIRTQADQ